MKYIKKVSALLMCALIALSACLTASAATALKPDGPYTLKINLYEAAKQAIIEDLDSLATIKGNGAETTPDSAFKKSTLAGVKFDIYPANPAKNGKEDDSTAQHATTDEYGVATFTTKTAGTYWVKVNSLPDAIAAVLDIQNGFAVDLPMTTNRNDWLSIVNVYPKVDTVWGKANFKKVVKGTTTGLPGAKFTLYRTDITQDMITAATTSYDQLVATLSASTGITWTEYNTDITSGPDGTFNTGRIPYGAYKLVETTPPKGYALDKTPRYFIIDGLNTTKNIKGVDITGDTYTIAEVSIDNVELDGIEKILTSPEDGTASIGDTVTWTISGKVPSDWGKANYTVYEITDTLHDAFEYLSSESTAIVGEDTVTLEYDEGTKTVTLDLLNGGYSAGEEITITIKAKLKANAALLTGITNTAELTYNNGGGEETETAYSNKPVKTGGRRFKKTDESGGVISSEATFEVYKIVDGEYIQVKNFYKDSILSSEVTNGWVGSNATNGMFFVFGLDYGTYYLKEVKAPSGYELYGKYIEFKISEGSYEGAELIITNKKSVTLPFTGGVGAEVVVASGVVMMVAAGFVLKKRVK